MLQALDHLHASHLYHGHLAPDSFRFLNERPHAPLKLVDFGLELKVSRWDATERQGCGEATWGAPPCPPQFFETCKLVFCAPDVVPVPGSDWRPGGPLGCLRVGRGSAVRGARSVPFAAQARALDGEMLSDAIDAHLDLAERQCSPLPEAADAWSIGAIAFLLLCGYPPFFAPCRGAVLGRIHRAEYSFDPPFWSKISEEAKDFVQRCLCQPSEDRLTMAKALEHPWIVSLADSSPSGAMFFSFLLNLRRFYRTSLIETFVANSLADRLSHRDMHLFLFRCREVDVGGSSFFTATDLRQVLISAGLAEVAEAISTRFSRSLRHPGESYIDYHALVDSACLRRERHFEEEMWRVFQCFSRVGPDEGRIPLGKLAEFMASSEVRTLLGRGGVNDEDSTAETTERAVRHRCETSGAEHAEFFEVSAVLLHELPPWPTAAPMQKGASQHRSYH